MHDFAWAALGGGMIGAAAVLLMASGGRVMGVSGIVGGLWPPSGGADRSWRLFFLAGLIAAPLVYALIHGAPPAITVEAGWPLLALAGAIVGAGVAIGHGCTSGHGVCGLARLSPRSAVATGVFMAVAIALVFVVRHLIGLA